MPKPWLGAPATARSTSTSSVPGTSPNSIGVTPEEFRGRSYSPAPPRSNAGAPAATRARPRPAAMELDRRVHGSPRREPATAEPFNPVDMATARAEYLGSP